MLSGPRKGKNRCDRNPETPIYDNKKTIIFIGEERLSLSKKGLDFNGIVTTYAAQAFGSIVPVVALN